MKVLNVAPLDKEDTEFGAIERESVAEPEDPAIALNDAGLSVKDGVVSLSMVKDLSKKLEVPIDPALDGTEVEVKEGVVIGMLVKDSEFESIVSLVCVLSVEAGNIDVSEELEGSKEVSAAEEAGVSNIVRAFNRDVDNAALRRLEDSAAFETLELRSIGIELLGLEVLEIELS